MTKGIGTIHVRKAHGKMEVQAMGQTPRGQHFIKRTIVLDVKNLRDPQFKEKLAAAINELAQSALPGI